MDNILKHLAIVLDRLSQDGTDEDVPPAERGEELMGLSCRIVDDAFARLPDLAILSLFSPELQRWALTPSVSADLYDRCRAGFMKLADKAREVGGDLFLLGRPADLPSPWPEILSLSPAAPERSRRVNFFLNYSGREELAAAAGMLLKDHREDEISEEALEACLTTAGQPDPDLIIYAGGDLEPKDFFLWQASYAEIWHTRRNCFEFSSDDLNQAVANFLGRHRRFGRV